MSEKLLQACKEFVRKVECGEARSIRSYAQMKEAIADYKGGAPSIGIGVEIRVHKDHASIVRKDGVTLGSDRDILTGKLVVSDLSIALLEMGGRHCPVDCECRQ